MLKLKQSLLFLFFFCSITLSGQTVCNCSFMRNGTFTMSTEQSGTIIIDRKESVQTESIKALHLKTKYLVTWADSCTYQLRNPQVVKGKPGYTSKPTDIITARITAIRGDSVFVRIHSNIDSRVMETVMLRIK